MIVALVLLAATASVPSETDVLLQLSAGKMLCSNPDAATKTCSTIAAYAASNNGAFVETAEVLLSPDQPLTLQTSLVVQIKQATICGVMEEADLQKGIVRINGTPLPADRNTLVLEKLMEKLKPLAGREICEGLRFENGRLMKYGQAERIDINLPGKPVSWITAADGYKVAPR